MHNSSMLRMEWFIKNYVDKKKKERLKVLDVGSYDINGSYKKLFSDKKYNYVGLDMQKGPNVDIVLANPYDWSEIKTGSYDIVISGQAFEHMEFFWIVMVEMVRVLKKGGLICIIVPQSFLKHRHPVDCYRFLPDGMGALARYTNLEILHIHSNCAPSKQDVEWYHDLLTDSILIGKKNYYGTTKLPNLKKYKCIPLNQEILQNGMVPYEYKK